MFNIYKNDAQHVVRVVRGEDLVEKVQQYCEENNIRAAWVQGIGACDLVMISSYNLEKKEYEKHEHEEEFELLSLIGNVSIVENKAFMHAHVTLGRRDMSVVGGHLHEMRISGTGEVFIVQLDEEFTRSKDEETGLSLLEGDKIM